MYSRSLPPRAIWGREGVPRPETLNALLGDYAESQTRDIQTCRHCEVVMRFAMCDRPMRPMRPTGRCHHQSSSITCLPLLENRPTPRRVGFSFLRAHRAGLPPSAPSAPSESMGAAHLSSLEPWRLSRGAKREREIAEHERAKRESSACAAGAF